MTLTKQQSEALVKLTAFQNKPGCGFFRLSGYSGAGKLQPMDAPVLTLSGWRTMKDIEPGSQVIGQNGLPVDVLETFPQKGLNIYTVFFDDGTNVECCEDHLWQVQTPKQTQRGTHSVLSLKEMIPNIESRKQNTKRYKYAIPLVEPVEHPEKPLLCDPYVLGYLLGDGCLATPGTRQVTINGDISDIEWLYYFLNNKDLDYNVSLHKTQGTCRRVQLSYEIKPKLQALGVLGIYSKEKFVPQEYLTASISQRKMLLAGLMDSDGSVKRYSASKVKTMFHSCSKGLAEGVAQLVRSLGGYAKMHTQDREEKGIEYRVSIRLWFNPFQLPRKKNVYKDYQPKFLKLKRIVSVKYEGKKDGKCILVDSKDHLYVTKDYIVTHNTYVITQFLLANRTRLESILIACPTNKAAGNLVKMLGGRVPVEITTVAVLLGQAPVLNEETGEEEFKVVHKDGKGSDQLKLLIVDEYSMVNKKDFQGIIDMAEGYDFKVVFVGDPAQLPPVKEKYPAATKFPFGDQQVELTEVVRYEGSLAEAAEEIRSKPKYNRYVYNFKSSKDEIIQVLDFNDWMSKGIDLVCSEEFKCDPFHVRFLAWRNRTVEWINAEVRERLQPNANGHEFLAGDRIILKAPVQSPYYYEIGGVERKARDLSYKRIFCTSDEMTLEVNSTLDVLNFVPEDIKKQTKMDPIEIEYWKIPYTHTFQYALHDDYTKLMHLRIPTDKGQEALDKALKHTIEYGRFWKGRTPKAWASYYFLKGFFHSATYAYALTVHRSQGSTIKNAFVDIDDMAQSTDLQKLQYTAVTRASDKLYIPI